MAKTKPTLEDYIFDMETRPPDDHGLPNDQDLWTRLEKKESDLLLAAELGKALLEKNEELAKQQEKIIEDYSKKLEVSHFYLILYKLYDLLGETKMIWFVFCIASTDCSSYLILLFTQTITSWN